MAIYLVEKDTSAVAHKLNGQIFEKLKQPEKVVVSHVTYLGLIMKLSRHLDVIKDLMRLSRQTTWS